MADSRKYSIFVGNLDPSTTDDRFLAYFRRECTGVRPGSEGGKIVRDEIGRSKKYGFVNFVDSYSANKVVSKKNHVIDGKKVICKVQNRKKNPIPSNRHKTEPKYFRKIHVGNLNVSTTNQQLKEYFQKFGSVVNAFVMRDNDKISKGYGFVEYRSSSMVDEVQDKRPHTISNKEVQTVRSYPSTVPIHLRKPATVLFIFNYNEKVKEEDIEEYFGEFGNVTEVLSHKKKRPDTLEDFKYLELHFDDYDAVDKICLADIANEHTINGCIVKVTKCLEDGLNKKRDAERKPQNTFKQNFDTMGVVSAPVPSAPLFLPEDLNQSPYNPYFVNIGHQQPSYPSLDTRTINPQPGSHNNNHFVNVPPNLYPSFETKAANPPPAKENTAPSSSTGSFRSAPNAPMRPERRKDECIIL